PRGGERLSPTCLTRRREDRGETVRSAGPRSAPARLRVPILSLSRVLREREGPGRQDGRVRACAGVPSSRCWDEGSSGRGLHAVEHVDGGEAGACGLPPLRDEVL